MKNVLVLLVLIASTAFVVADLPIHCLASQVAGTWEFELSDASSTTRDHCGYQTPDKSFHRFDGSYTYKLETASKLTVSLNLPDHKATSPELEDGHWTMVYNEGFSVVIDKLDFFAFSRYEMKPGFTDMFNLKPENYISTCGETLIGWYKNGDKFGCWRGKQITPQFPDLKLVESKKTKHEVEDSILSPTAEAFDTTKTGMTQADIDLISQIEREAVSAIEEELLNEFFVPDQTLIDAVNNDPNALWIAATHEDFLGKTNREMAALTGSKQYVEQEAYQMQPESEEFYFQDKYTEDLIQSSMSSPRYEAFLEDQEADFDFYDYEDEDTTDVCEYGLPCSIDWRNHNGHNWISKPRNQLKCGSCYSMGTMASLESRMRIKHDDPSRPRYSIQHGICTPQNQGCDGGFPYLVAKNIEHHGVVTEKCLPYAANEQKCNVHHCNVEYPIRNVRYVGGFAGGVTEELLMKELVLKGPIAVAFEAPGSLFSYKSGIFTGPMPRSQAQGVDGVREWYHANHAVVIVGYGSSITSNGHREKYWIVLNSWGQKWGEGGYFRIRRGTNECGIEALAVTFDL